MSAIGDTTGVSSGNATMTRTASQVWLYRAKEHPHKRHIKVQGEANPYDPRTKPISKIGKVHMLDTFRGTKLFAFSGWNNTPLPSCNIKITRITGWRLHHCVPL